MVDRRFDGAFLVLLFLGHVALVLVVLPSFVQDQYTSNIFQDSYDLIAKNLTEGLGYRYFADTAQTLQRTPAYPFFLATIFLGFGYNLHAAQVANTIFDLLTALLVYLTVPLVCTGRSARLWAVAIVLLHPGILVSATRGGVESMLVLSLALFLWLFMRALKDGTRSSYLLAGAALGFSCLVKPTTILFPLFWLPCLLALRLHHQDLKRNLVGTFLMISMMVVVFSPWVLRNYVVAQRLVPTMTILGISVDQNLHICRDTDLFEGKVKPIVDSKERYERLANAQGRRFHGSEDCCGPYFLDVRDEVEFDDFLKQRTLAEYMRNPSLIGHCMARNSLGFWFAGKNRTAVLTNVAVQLPVLLLAVFGAWCVLKGDRRKVPVAAIAFIAYFYAIHVMVLAFARHSVPLVPALAIFGGIGVAVCMEGCVSWFRARHGVAPSPM